MVIQEFRLAQDGGIIKLLLIKLFVIEVNYKVEGSKVVLLLLLILLAHWIDFVFCVAPFLMHIVAGYQDYFNSLVVRVILFTKNIQIIGPIYTI